MKTSFWIVAFVLVMPPLSTSAQPQAEGFVLTCTSADPGATTLKLNVLIYMNGAEVTHVGLQPPNEFALQVYANALVWSDGISKYEADRMTGTLRVKPSGQTYSCEKIAGKKF